MKCFCKLIIAVLAGMFLCAHAYAAVTDDIVEFSVPGGFYTGNQDLKLTLDGYEIRYTTDGTEPTKDSQVLLPAAEISVQPREETEGFPLTDKLNADLKPTAMDAEKTMSFMVVKAKGFKGENETKTFTNTYFIDSNIFTLFGGLPVISASVEEADFTGSDNGIYLKAGTEIDVQMFLEYYMPDGTLGFKHSASTKVYGQSSILDRKKSLRFNFTKGDYEDDGELLDFEAVPNTTMNIYNDSPIKQFGKLNIRTSDWQRSMIKEQVAQTVTSPLRTDRANFIPTAVFINGEFWGIYDLREQYDNNYIASHYDMPKKEVVMMSFDWGNDNPKFGPKSAYEPAEADTNFLCLAEYNEGPGKVGEADGETYYFDSFMEFYDLITSPGFKDDPLSFEKLNEMIDVDNFIDYIISYTYLENWDWPGNNMRLWRHVNNYAPDANVPYGHDGRWRFVNHDFDMAIESYNVNTLRRACGLFLETDNPKESTLRDSWPKWSTNLLYGFMSNKQIRDRYATRVHTYAATAFNYDNRVKGLLDTLESNMTNAVSLDIERWKLGTKSDWEKQVGDLHKFFEERAGNQPGLVESFYDEVARKAAGDPEVFSELHAPGDSGLPRYRMAEVIFSTDSDKGWFEVAGAQIRPDLYGSEMADSFTVKYLPHIDIEIKAVAQPGYKLSTFNVEVKYNNNVNPRQDGNTLIITPGNYYDITVSAEFEESEEATSTVTSTHPTNGWLTENETITLSSQTPNAKIKYSIYRGEQATSEPLITGEKPGPCVLAPFSLVEDADVITIKAYAAGAGFIDGPETSFTYRYSGDVQLVKAVASKEDIDKSGVLRETFDIGGTPNPTYGKPYVLEWKDKKNALYINPGDTNDDNPEETWTWEDGANLTLSFSTIGYKNLRFYNEMYTTEQGPKYVNIEYSTDGTNYKTLLSDVEPNATDLGAMLRYENLPAVLANCEKAYIRFSVTHNETQAGNPLFGTPKGNLGINNIGVTGTKINETDIIVRSDTIGDAVDITVYVKNDSGVSISPVIVAAFYSEHGKLLSVFEHPLGPIAAGASLGQGDHDISFPVDNAQTESVKFFLWNGINTLNPLCGAELIGKAL